MSRKNHKKIKNQKSKIKNPKDRQSTIINKQSQELFLSEEQLDFLTEMMNVGAGNAATALSQMLRWEVDLEIPTVNVFPAPRAYSCLGDPSLPVACVRMAMIGEVAGDLFFIVPDEHKRNLIHLAKQASGLGNTEWPLRNEQNREEKIQNPKSKIQNPKSEDLSVVTEIGNILAGVYLTAIHDFCKLNIHHSVPTIAIDMIQSLLDEPIVVLGRENQAIILIKNEFTVKKKRVTSFLLMVPSVQSMKILVDSIEQAREIMRGKAGNE